MTLQSVSKHSQVTLSVGQSSLLTVRFAPALRMDDQLQDVANAHTSQKLYTSMFAANGLICRFATAFSMLDLR